MTNCCEKCAFWDNCEQKWFRGERHEEQVCCERCGFYHECNPQEKTRRLAKTGRKKKRQTQGEKGAS